MPARTEHTRTVTSAPAPAAKRPAADAPTDDRSARRWISRRIAQLDPETDYAEIVRLHMSFQIDDFFGDWVAAQSMPRFATSPSAPAIYRGGTGKLIKTSGRRLHDTGNHAFVWAEFGIDSPETRRSMDMINALHAKYAAEYPSAFDDPDLWMYVLSWEVCGVSATLTRYLGLPEPDEKVKRAMAAFGARLTELFVYIDGRTLAEAVPVPSTYEEWVAALDHYESRQWPYSDEAARCAEAVLGHFEQRFPRPLRRFGRALVTSFWYDGLLAGNGVKPPGRVTRWIARSYIKARLIAGAIRPDSKESWVEHESRVAAESGEPVTHVLRVALGGGARRDAAPAAGAPAGRCPFGHDAGPHAGAVARGPSIGQNRPG